MALGQQLEAKPQTGHLPGLEAASVSVAPVAAAAVATAAAAAAAASAASATASTSTAPGQKTDATPGMVFKWVLKDLNKSLPYKRDIWL